jgi:hypothetical protein
MMSTTSTLLGYANSPPFFANASEIWVWRNSSRKKAQKSQRVIKDLERDEDHFNLARFLRILRLFAANAP